jgi:hypothetical protein
VEPRGNVGPHGNNGYTRPRDLDKMEADEVAMITPAHPCMDGAANFRVAEAGLANRHVAAKPKRVRLRDDPIPASRRTHRRYDRCRHARTDHFPAGTRHPPRVFVPACRATTPNIPGLLLVAPRVSLDI